MTVQSFESYFLSGNSRQAQKNFWSLFCNSALILYKLHIPICLDVLGRISIDNIQFFVKKKRYAWFFAEFFLTHSLDIKEK